jgi:hypothetical protein
MPFGRNSVGYMYSCWTISVCVCVCVFVRAGMRACMNWLKLLLTTQLSSPNIWRLCIYSCHSPVNFIWQKWWGNKPIWTQTHVCNRKLTIFSGLSFQEKNLLSLLLLLKHATWKKQGQIDDDDHHHQPPGLGYHAYFNSVAFKINLILTQNWLFQCFMFVLPVPMQYFQRFVMSINSGGCNISTVYYLSIISVTYKNYEFLYTVISAV